MRWAIDSRQLSVAPCILFLLTLSAAPVTSQAPPAERPSTAPPGAAQAPSPPPPPEGVPEPPAPQAPAAPPSQDVGVAEAGEIELIGETGIRGRLVKVTIGEYVLTGTSLSGDLNRELIFSDGATLTYREQVVTGDTIRFFPGTKEYRVENVRSALSPRFLQGRIQTPLFVRGQALYGVRRRPIFGDDLDATTCNLEDPHYFFRAEHVVIEPNRRAILKKASVYLWGRRLFTLPTLVIPLERRRTHTGYTPEVGRSVEEGWFAKSAFNYLAANRQPGIFRLDLMEKKGIGTGAEQAWNTAKIAGLAALYAIPTGGTSRNLAGRLNNRLNLGGGQLLDLTGDFQRNSYLQLPETTTMSTRLGYSRNVQGSNTTLSLGRQSNSSQGFSNNSLTAALAQGFQIGSQGSASFNADYSSYTTGGAASSSTNQTLSTRFQADQRAPNYTLQAVANKNIPVGERTGFSSFGGVERFPEINVSNFRFARGALAKWPVTFQLSVGQYGESGSPGFGGGAGTEDLRTERALLGFDVSNTRLALSPKTDLNITGGFQQFFYGPGYAQYVVKNNTSLTQRWGKRSGLNLNYSYQRPEGGTPFRFDHQGNYHTLNLDLGQLDDSRAQITLRTGYDFAQQSFPGAPARPWQTMSINTLLRPVNWARMRNLFSYDPNTGKFVTITSELRFRGPGDFFMDIVSRYDPQRHKFGNINAMFDIPVGGLFRVLGILQYNGYLSKFESRQLQFIRDLHCLEAVLTYIDNPFGFRKDRQLLFQLRIKGLPFFQKVGAGQFGQALDTGVGGLY